MQQVKFGSAAVEGDRYIEETEDSSWASLALKQDRVLQLMEARHRAALAVPRIGIIRCVR